MSSPYISYISSKIVILGYQFLVILLIMEENSNTAFLLNLPFTMVTFVDTDQHIDQLLLIAATQAELADCEGIVQHIKNITYCYNTLSE